MSLYSFSRRLARRLAAATATPERGFDPIDHPAIAAMGLREIADLPLAPPHRRAEAARPERAAA